MWTLRAAFPGWSSHCCCWGLCHSSDEWEEKASRVVFGEKSLSRVVMTVLQWQGWRKIPPDRFFSWLFFTWYYELGLHMHSLMQQESPVYKALTEVFKTSGVSGTGIKLFCTFGMQNHFVCIWNESKLLCSLLLLPLCSVTVYLGFQMTLCPRD